MTEEQKLAHAVKTHTKNTRGANDSESSNDGSGLGWAFARVARGVETPFGCSLEFWWFSVSSFCPLFSQWHRVRSACWIHCACEMHILSVAMRTPV